MSGEYLPERRWAKVSEGGRGALRWRVGGGGGVGLVWRRGAVCLRGGLLLAKLLLVMDDAVAVREGATLDVLARDAHVVALEEEGAPCKLLSERPVDGLARAV